ncbi:hypothetical protein BGW38_009593, partial [Lunasporangiospora selenospora]
NTSPQTKRAVLRAGQTIKTEYKVGAAHGGGHCQWALSYDNGKTWVVFQTLIRDCLRNIPNGGKYSVNVKIPASAPSGKAIFQWIWNNAIGNRELYSNCVVPLLANYGPKSLLIGEFPRPADKDGREAFAKRRKITVRVPAKGAAKGASKAKNSKKN